MCKVEMIGRAKLEICRDSKPGKNLVHPLPGSCGWLAGHVRQCHAGVATGHHNQLTKGDDMSRAPDADGWVSLCDTQWMNIVNHDHAYESMSKEEAVNHAVKMTEAKLREINVAASQLGCEVLAVVERKEVHGHMCVFINRTPSNRDIPDGTKLYARPASPDLAAALLAILKEVDAELSQPHSADSYLPAHLIEQARAALEKAGAV